MFLHINPRMNSHDLILKRERGERSQKTEGHKLQMAERVLVICYQPYRPFISKIFFLFMFYCLLYISNIINDISRVH